jgi:flavorubredoxin
MLDLSQHKLRFLVTPYVHAWDSVLAYDEMTGALFSSDLFLQPGPGPALTDPFRSKRGPRPPFAKAEGP